MADSAFQSLRKIVTDSLAAAGLTEVKLNPMQEPSILPCGIVEIVSETGRDKVQHGFLTIDFGLKVMIVVDASAENPDPDNDLFAYKELFRQAFLAARYEDIGQAEYYSSMFGAIPVRVCSIPIALNGDIANYCPFVPGEIGCTGVAGSLYHGLYKFTASGTDRTITAAQLMTHAGVPAGKEIIHISIPMLMKQSAAPAVTLSDTAVVYSMTYASSALEIFTELLVKELIISSVYTVNYIIRVRDAT